MTDPTRLPTYYDRFDYLTPTQRLIARLLYEGYTQREVADGLLCSRSTIARQVGRIRRLVVERTKRCNYFDEY